MFYVKDKITANTTIEVEIDYDNTYCHCPYCGKEVKVDLCEFLKEEDTDLHSTMVLCDDCAADILEAHHGKQV